MNFIMTIIIILILHQVDYKMPTPTSLMSLTLSNNLIKWYKNLRWMINTNGKEINNKSD